MPKSERSLARRFCGAVTGIFIQLVPIILLTVLTFLGGLLFHLTEEPVELEEALADNIDIKTHTKQNGIFGHRSRIQ